jgi:flagellar basal body-associated protein FliL
LETTKTQPKRKRPVLVILLALLLLAAAGTAVVNLFSQSLVTPEQKHDHDGDGRPDH